MPCDPILVRSTLALFMGVSAASVEQRPAIGGAARPVNSGCCSFPVYRSGVSELTNDQRARQDFITHSDRLLTFTANGNTFTTDDRFTQFIGPKQPSLIDQPQEEGT